MTVTRLNPPSLFDASALGYSHISVTEASKHIFISGQTAWSPDDSEVPESIGAQAEIAAGNVAKALTAAGATPEDVTLVRVYGVDLTEEALGEIIPSLTNLFGDATPCLTILGIASLAFPALKIEIEVTAAI